MFSFRPKGVKVVKGLSIIEKEDNFSVIASIEADFVTTQQ